MIFTENEYLKCFWDIIMQKQIMCTNNVYMQYLQIPNNIKKPSKDDCILLVLVDIFDMTCLTSFLCTLNQSLFRLVLLCKIQKTFILWKDIYTSFVNMHLSIFIPIVKVQAYFMTDRKKKCCGWFFAVNSWRKRRFGRYDAYDKGTYNNL